MVVEVEQTVSNLLSRIKACTITKDIRRGEIVHAAAADCGCETNVYIAGSLLDMYAKCGRMDKAQKIFNKMKHCNVVSWTTLMLGYVENGNAKIALEVFALMHSKGCEPNDRTFVVACKACRCIAVEEKRLIDDQPISLNKAKAIELLSKQSGVEDDIFVAISLLNAFTMCGSLVDARRVFEGLTTHNVVSWTSMISGYAENGKGWVAFELYMRMHQEGCSPNSRTFVAILKTNTNLALEESGINVDGKLMKVKSLMRGLNLHLHVNEGGWSNDVFIASCLIEMYAKCGSMKHAQNVFDATHKRDDVCVTCLISGYAEDGESDKALETFANMETFSAFMFVAALKACNTRKALENGMAIHSRAICTGWVLDKYVSNALLVMYARSGSMKDAHNMFDRIPLRDVVSWNALLFGYVENGEGEQVLKLFADMDSAPNRLTFVAVFKSCSVIAELENGVEVDGKLVKFASLELSTKFHFQARKLGFTGDLLVASTLVDLYANCGSLVNAREVFENMKIKTVVSWNAIIQGYANNGEAHVSLELFERMKREGFAPDARTFVTTLKACGMTSNLETGRKIHKDICRLKMQTEAFVVSSLVDFYGRCGSISDAQKVFDSVQGSKDVVTWTSLMTGYSRSGNTNEVLRLFEAMKEVGVKPNGVTFLAILSACSHGGIVQKGKEIFESMLPKYGVHPNIEHYVCMISILGRANELNEALTMLKNMPFKPDDKTWTTVLGACSDNLAMERSSLETLLMRSKLA